MCLSAVLHQWASGFRILLRLKGGQEMAVPYQQVPASCRSLITCRANFSAQRMQFCRRCCELSSYTSRHLLSLC